MNIDIEKFLSELENKNEKSIKSSDSEKRKKQEAITEKINKLGDEIISES